MRFFIIFFFGHTVLVSRWPPNKVSLFWKYKDQSCAYKTAARISHYATHIIHSKIQKRASSLLIVLLKHNILIIKEPAPPFYLQTTHTNQCSVADGAIKHNMNFILNTTKITKKTKKHTQTPLFWNTSTSAWLRRRRWCTGAEGPLFKVNVSFFEVFSLISTQFLSFLFRLSPHHCSFGS